MLQKVGFAVVHTRQWVRPHDRPMYVVYYAIKEDTYLSIGKILEQLSDIVNCKSHAFSGDFSSYEP
jgi:hypothetical protein